ITHRLFRRDGSVRRDLERQAFVIDRLTDTCWLHRILHVFDWREDGIDGDDTDGIIRLFIVIRWHVSTAAPHSKLHVQPCIRAQYGNVVFRIEHHVIVRNGRDVGSGPLVGAFQNEVDVRIGRVNGFETNTLQIENDIGYVFGDTRHGGEFVLYTVDFDRGNSDALE